MQELNRVSLGALRAVEAAARGGSLRAAADELGVTPGAVSQKINNVERQLGRMLFERQPKGLRLTPLGEKVAAHLTQGMRELAAGVALANTSDSEALVVSVAPVFAEKWLVWRLKEFNDIHPDVRIRMEATVDLVDPDTSDIDMCIRVGRGSWPGGRAEHLLDHLVFPVCSPALAETLSSPRDLAGVPIIRDAQAMFDWNVWLEPEGLSSDMLGEGPIYSNASLCVDAAMAGQGVFLGWETLADAGLRSRRLAAPFPGRRATGLAYWLLTNSYAPKPRPVRQFEAWLRDQLGQLGEAAISV